MSKLLPWLVVAVLDLVLAAATGQHSLDALLASALTHAAWPASRLKGSVTPAFGPALVLTADPPFVAWRGYSILSWDIDGASSCSVTANGFNLWTGTAASVNTSTYGLLAQDTTYALNCAMNDGTNQSGHTVVRVPVQVPDDAFSFAEMRGGNIFDGDFWFSNTPHTAGTAAGMNINFLRINMNMWQAINGSSVPRFMRTLNESLAALHEHSLRAILVFGGYVEYDQRCGNYGSFTDVEPLARQVVTAFGSHPALFAFELMNEAYSEMGDGLKCNKTSIRESVVAMYEIVRTLAPAVPTSVSEAWFWWYLPTWAHVSSFASFHIYPPVSSPLNASQVETAEALIAKNIDDARQVVSPLPLMMGEFGDGAGSLTAPDQAWFYRAMYRQLRAKDIGSFFWDLSVSDRKYGVLYSNGTLKPAAVVITVELEGNELRKHSPVMA
jgi:hypothetical protein